MKIKGKSPRKTSTNRSSKKKWYKSRWTNWLFASEWFPLPSLLSYESIVSVKENSNRKRKKEERKKRKKKNMDRTKTKLNAPHAQYDVKVIPQELIIRDK